MEKFRLILSGLGLFLLFGWLVAGARAQMGACPTNSYLLGEPGGWYPADVNACAYVQFQVSVADDSDDYYPCSQYVAVNAGDILDIDRNQPGYSSSVVVVPASATYYGDLAYLRFMVFGRPTFPLTGLIPPGHGLPGDSIRIEYHSSAGNLVDYIERPLTDYTVVSTWYDDGLGVNHYYQVYMIEQSIYTSEGSGGWFAIRILFDDTIDPDRRNFGVSSMRLGSISDTLPEHCPIPNANLPATPAPATPTGTIPATWTPNPTPSATPVITPGVTAPGITPFPTVTLTPFVFPTIEAENTPTPWAAIDIPTIAWPTRDLVIYAAAATIDSQSSGLESLASGIDSAWSTPASFSSGALDTGITTTTGYGAPITLVMSVTQGISLPISYAKAIGDYMPNFGPYLAGLLAIAAWMVFNYIAKYGIQVVAFVFELIRKVWEAIPLN